MEFNFMDSHRTSVFTVAIGVSILTALVHIVFAVAIYRDAARLNRSQALAIGGIGPIIWCLATLVGGVITAGIYWAMHHSRLNPKIPTSSTEDDETDV